MSVSPITANANTSAATAASATTDSFANPSSALNQADFLQLLVAQMQYQDPMDPQSDTDMAAQLAQFTSLQQATQTTSSLAMMQATSLVGSTVTLQVNSTESTSGVVTGVVVSNNTPEITVGGTNYQLSQVTAITPPNATANASADNAANAAADSAGTPTSSNTQTTP